MRRILRGLRADPRRDVGDELRFHIEMRTQEFIEQGMSVDDARRAAMAAFGDLPAIDAKLRAERQSRDRSRRRLERFRDMVMDVRFALRTLGKSPGFTLATLATLALGIGAALAVFTVVNGVLLRPLPYPDPGRLALVWTSAKDYGTELPVSGGMYNDLADSTAEVEPLAAPAAFRAWAYTMAGGAEPEHVDGVRVTPSFFNVVGVRPAMGRAFNTSDADSGAAPVVILSDALWRSRFGANRNVIGQRVMLSGQSFTVVAVMPPDFTFPRGAELPPGLEFGQRTELWTPLGFSAAERRNYGTQNLAAIVRLRPGVTEARVHAAIEAQLARWIAANAPNLDMHAQLATLKEQAGEHVRRGLLLLAGAVILLLCIACANVTNLLIARTSRRRREFAVRAALGAGRARIAGQLVTENMVLAVGGSVLGLLVSFGATRAMLSLVPGSMPRADDITVDWRVWAAVSVLAVGAGVIFGIAATLHAGARQLGAALRDDARSGDGRGAGIGRRALVVGEVSLSLVLLIVAALLTVSFARLQQVASGIDPSHAITAEIALPVPGGFNPERDGPGWTRFFDQLQDRVSHASGVVASGGVSVLPLTGAAETGSTWTFGDPPPLPGKAHETDYLVVEGDYFRAIGIKLLEGRAFESVDRADGPGVAIVNREYARKYLGGHALGKGLLTFFDFARRSKRREIVGVVDNVQDGVLGAPLTPEVYVPQSQMTYPVLQWVVRTNADPSSAIAVLRREVKATDPTVAVTRPRAVQQLVDDSLARQRFSMTLIGCFAAAALLLAVIGLYGVIALSVTSRQREIGVRVALGAQSADVVRLVLREGWWISAAGVTIGIAGAYLASRLLSGFLYGVSATSATVYAGAAAITVVVALCATLVPASRATRVEPVAALREG